LLLASDALVGCSSNSSEPTATEDGGDGASQGSPGDGSLDGGGDARSVDATVEDAAAGDAAADAGGQQVDSGDAETTSDAGNEADSDAATPADAASDGAEIDASADAAAADGGSDATADGASVDAGGGPSDASTDAESEAAASDAGSDAELATATDGASDAIVEASGDAGDAGISETLSIILSTQGSDCATCAATYCLGSGQQTCEALGTAVAASGPSAGTLRSTLCFQTLSCLVNPAPGPDSGATSPCYEEGTVPEVCYCGTIEDTTQCETNGPGADAQCGTDELAGLETTDPATAWTLFNETMTTTLGAQMANAIGNCLGGVGPNQCGGYCFF
jgi:hypothetical protein